MHLQDPAKPRVVFLPDARAFACDPFGTLLAASVLAVCDSSALLARLSHIAADTDRAHAFTRLQRFLRGQKVGVVADQLNAFEPDSQSCPAVETNKALCKQFVSSFGVATEGNFSIEAASANHFSVPVFAQTRWPVKVPISARTFA